jgi:hypothetical protein
MNRVPNETSLAMPKQFFAFTKEDGAENHWQSGALSFKDEIVFNWIDNIFKR